MKIKVLERVMAMLVCAFLLMGVSLPTAFAYVDEGQSQAIIIRITPPVSGAAVEVCITDNAGAGFQSAHVKVGSGSWQEVTGELEQTGNRYYCVVDITENCTVYVRAAGQDGTIYEKSEYINCFNTSSASASADPAAELDTTPRSPTALTPDGQGTVMDNVTSADRKEFFTFSTPDNNTFYLVIDRERDSENVYFLNAVTESDLMALAEKDTDKTSQSAIPEPEPVCICKDKCVPGEVNTACPVCVLSWKDCTGTASANASGDTEPEQQAKSAGAGSIIVILLAVLAVGGAGWYLKIYKPKKELADAEDLDELTGGEEETINEDEDGETANRPEYDAYEEPDYPDGYNEPEDGE